MDDQALLPQPSDLMRTVEEFRKPHEEEERKAFEERAIKEFANDPRWIVVKKLIKEEIQNMKSLTDLEITGSETPADIGIRFMLASLAAEKLQWVIDLIEGIDKAVDLEHGTTE